MRRGGCGVLFCLLLSSCGYVGPVVPPSPEVPNAITDLKVVESGGDLVVNFTTPTRTLDNLSIQRFSLLDLRIGPYSEPLDLNKWAESAKEYDLPLPPENEKDVARPANITFKIPAKDWSGKKVVVAVRSAIKKDKDYSNWSNVQQLLVEPPLAAPELAVMPTPQGYKLTMKDEGPGVSYEAYRQGAPDQPPVPIGTSDKPEYIDNTAQFGTPYIYSVVAKKSGAESPFSNKVPVNAPDVYPPATPSGLTGVASANAVELSWQRSPELDLQGYLLYRSTNGGPFERTGKITNLPAFTDTGVQHGATYRYQVSAVDRANNESARSEAVEVRFP